MGADTGNARDRIINVEGQDVTADPGGPAAAGPTPGMAASKGFTGFNEIAAPRDVKVIKIPISLIKSGELKYNIPIRANDRILVQNLEIGEYYMGGHVSRPGAYTLTGRRITLKQAITAASGLDQLAIPQRTDIIRRINKNQEVFVRVDLAQVFEGQRPDIYLKPDDQIMVGTNPLAPFLAAARGAFRFTYGLGFLYDRNLRLRQQRQRPSLRSSDAAFIERLSIANRPPLDSRRPVSYSKSGSRGYRNWPEENPSGTMRVTRVGHSPVMEEGGGLAATIDGTLYA